LQPKQWVASLVNINILNLFELPHFVMGKDVNNCVKNLLAVLHGGILWMDAIVSIDVKLISFIAGLASNDEKSTRYMDDKTKENALAKEMKKTYGTERGSCDIIIKWISHRSTRIETKLML